MNPAKTLTLYDFQGYKVDSTYVHIKAGRDVALEEPTGAGKTVQGIAVSAHLMAEKVITHTIIIAPQCQIEAGFLGKNDSLILWPKSLERSKPIKIPAGFVRTAREGKRGSAREILAYLATPNPGYALATTHGAMRTLFKLRMAEFPERLDGCLLFVDEAHHVGAERLTVVTEEWYARGGRQIRATATPFRGDGVDPIREGMTCLRRTIPEQIADGLAPAVLGHEIVAIGAKGDRVTGKEFAGEDASKNHFEQIVVLMTAKWIEKGKPKTIIRVPPMRGGNGGLVNDLKQRLRKVGARVFDATGTAPVQKKRFRDMLNAERDRSYAESQYDVVIGCMRVLEGSDWPVCSHVFSLGIPRPIGTAMQLAGRALRKKADDHPSANRAELVSFVPCAGGEALAALGLDHSRHALLFASYLADYQVGEEYAIVDAMRKGLGIKPGDDLEIEVDKAARIDPMLIAEAKAHIAQAVEDRPEITMADLVEHVAKAMPDSSRNDVVGIVLRIKASTKTEAGRDVKEAIEAGFAASDKVRPDIAEERRRVFDEVLGTFRDETLADSDGLKAFAAQIHTLTAGGMRSVVERLRNASIRGGLLTEELIVGWIREWKRRTGSFPKRSTFGEIPGTGENWKSVDEGLRRGYRGLRGGDSLHGLICRNFGVAKRPGRPRFRQYEIAKIRQWVVLWIESHDGRHPGPHGVKIPNSDGATWRGIDSAFRNGSCGLANSGYKSLSDFLVKEFGIRPYCYLHDLQIPQIIEWIREHLGANGRFPTKTSGPIPGSGGESWSSIDNAGKKGCRGLPKGYTLAKIIADHFPDAPTSGVKAYMARSRKTEQACA